MSKGCRGALPCWLQGHGFTILPNNTKTSSLWVKEIHFLLYSFYRFNFKDTIYFGHKRLSALIQTQWIRLKLDRTFHCHRLISKVGQLFTAGKQLGLEQKMSLSAHFLHDNDMKYCLLYIHAKQHISSWISAHTRRGTQQMQRNE